MRGTAAFTPQGPRAGAGASAEDAAAGAQPNFLPACKAGNLDAVKAAIECGARVGAGESGAAFAAARHGHVQLLPAAHGGQRGVQLGGKRVELLGQALVRL